MSSSNTTLELRAYLRGERPELDENFENFLSNVELFIRLRVKAEELHVKLPHRAKNRRGALPLDWQDIFEILKPDTEQPQESLASLVARDCVSELALVAEDLRKILLRERKRVQLSLVQQVDAHCLRWLTRQPGRDAVEKAGNLQRILAVVRRESYNTLENRVLIDFAQRMSVISKEYLEKNKRFLKDYKIVQQVKRLHSLCLRLTHNEVLAQLPRISSMPHPNYVLRQERRYSKIWQGYCRIIRHATIAEQLWEKRAELEKALQDLYREAVIHANPCAHFHSPLWFPQINGKNELIEKPFWRNELLQDRKSVYKEAPINTDGNDLILDLASPPRDLLIYSKRHPNSEPYLQNYSKPSIEDFEDKEFFYLDDLLRSRDHVRLTDYFKQLKALVGGSQWVVLVPDDWDAEWQERVIQAIPLPRSKIFLLWRSVATALGGIEHLNAPRENQTLAITDYRDDGTIFCTMLTLSFCPDGKTLIPQRKSYSRHRTKYLSIQVALIHEPNAFDRFIGAPRGTLYISPPNKLKCENFSQRANHRLKNTAENCLAQKGAKIFLERREKGLIPYYDELEALYLIVQTYAETIESKELVAHNEKHPGGQPTELLTIKNAAMIDSNTNSIRFLLCMGDADSDSPLKEYRHNLEFSIVKDVCLDMHIQMTPGKGMAIIDVKSPELRHSLRLDFVNNMHPSTDTIRTLENNMERSFPPHTPTVYAHEAYWNNVKEKVKQYLNDEINPDGDWFAKASLIYPGSELPPSNLSPLEKLRRRNVFGNDPKYRYPYQNTLFRTFDFNALFKKLVNDYQSPIGKALCSDLIRLIAWTYAYDCEYFTPIKNDIIARYVEYSLQSWAPAPLKQELTLCANLCSKKSEWSSLFFGVQRRISDYNNSVANDFYLLQNLLQFHPNILAEIDINSPDTAWLWVEHFPHWIETYRSGGGTVLNYILKSLLYFLRCRLYDGKKFLTRDHDTDRYNQIMNALNGKVHRNALATQQIVLKYIDGQGKLDDIPLLIKDNE